MSSLIGRIRTLAGEVIRRAIVDQHRPLLERCPRVRVVNRDGDQRNPTVTHPDCFALERNLVGPGTSGSQRCGHPQRWQVSIAISDERRDPTRDPVVVEREEVVAEGERGGGQLMEWWGDKGPLFDERTELVRAAPSWRRRLPRLAAGHSGTGRVSKEDDVARRTGRRHHR